MVFNRGDIMRRKYFLLLLIVIYFSGCGPKDYTSDMKKILDPMQKKLATFYKEKKRFPNINERNTLLKESKCKVVNNRCEYGENSFLIGSKKDEHNGYRLKLELGKSHCYTGLFSSGNPSNVSCTQDGSLDIGQ